MAGRVTSSKAKKIMRDGEVRGKPLSKAQRGFFGSRAAGKPAKRNGKGKR